MGMGEELGVGDAVGVTVGEFVGVGEAAVHISDADEPLEMYPALQAQVAAALPADVEEFEGQGRHPMPNPELEV